MQTNKNLLLSKEALVNSTPALEIFADDVKCKHGSTIGQLDANALFYLRSRGIGEAEARALLTWAFAADVAERIRIPSVRAEVERALGQRLPGAGLGGSPMSTAALAGGPAAGRPTTSRSPCARTFRSSRGASTASRSSISTTRRRRRSRSP